MYKDGSNSIRVFSSLTLGSDEKVKIQEILEGKIGKKVDVDYLVDEKIIGGIRVYIGSKVIDLTFNGKLEQVKEVIANEN